MENKDKRVIKFQAWILSENRMVDCQSVGWNSGYGSYEIFVAESDFEPYEEIVLKKKPAHRKSPIGIESFVDKLNPFFLRQFTGLKDKHNVDIYEGDVLYDPDCFGIITGGDLYPDKRQVVWNSDEAKFELIFLAHEEYAKEFRPSGRYLCKNNSETYSVIGNIYQHPNLLV